MNFGPQAAVQELESHNEVMIVVLAQLSRALGRGPGYPNDAFVRLVWETGSSITESLSWCVRSALERVISE
jgi:hypothetical protein